MQRFAVFKTGTEGEQAGPTVLRLAIGAAEAASVREETWNGKTYTVAPVIAIVEGVLHGANSPHPEFADAEAFGAFPEAWNYRPLTLGHPKVGGVFVSAGTPDVLDAFAMGFIFNTELDKKKLRTEAWIDNALCQEKGGQFQETLDKIKAGEVINVSVGCFIQPKYGSGVFEGKKYGSSWGSVAPDHLAILPLEVGACSVADGCGIPRINSTIDAEGKKQALDPAIFVPDMEASANTAPCCDACANKGGHMPGETQPQPQPTVETQQTAETAASIAARDAHRAAAFQELFGLTGNEGAEAGNGIVLEGFAGEDLDLAAFNVAGVAAALSINEVPDSLTFQDIRTLLTQAIVEQMDIPYYDLDVLAVTTQVVVFWQWGVNRQAHQIAYTVTDTGDVTFTGVPEPVNLLLRIQPRQTSGPSTMEGSATMAEQPGTQPEGVQPEGTTTEGASGQQPASTPVVESAAPTFETLLAAASPELREQFEMGARALASQRTALINKIKANSLNPFTDEQLTAKSITELEQLAAFAATPSQVGRHGAFVAPTDPAGSQGNQGLSGFAAANVNYLVPAAAAGADK